MATTIQSGRASSPLLTADVASRAEVYGGRGLVFDGASDYLDCGTGLGNKLGDNYSKDSGLTISLWFKADETNVTRGLLSISSFSDSFGQLFIRLASNELQFKLNNNWTRSVAFTDLGWNHIAVVYADTKENSKMYLNGTAVGSESGSFPSSLNLNGLKTVIGGFYSSSFTFNGSMADVKIHSSALTEAEVQSQYLKPESVPSPSTLVAWYPMCESNPESPQSIVYDHSEKKLGSEALTANDTLTGSTSSNWGLRSGWDSNSKHSNTTLTHNDTSVFSQGALKVTATGATGHLAVVLADNNFNYNPDNKLLRIKFKYKVVQIDGSSIQIGVGTGGGHFTAVGNPSAETSTTDIVEFDKIMDWGSNAYFLAWCVNINTIEFHVTDFSVKEVLMGNHATTSFFGSELVTNGGFESDGTGWTNIGSPTTSEINTNSTYVRTGSKSWKIVADGDDDGIYQTVTQAAGKTYSVEAYVYIVSGAVELFSNGASIATSNTTGSFQKLSGTYTFGSNTTLTVRSFNASGTFYIDDVSLKEVGVLSTGFTTAQNEPVIPQIPLVKYNEKMLFGGSNSSTQNDRVENFGDVCISGDFTISFWYLQSANHGWTLLLYYSSLFALYGKSDGVFQLRLGDTTYIDFSYTHELNTLRHFVFTRSSGTIKLYVNGVEQSDTETHSGDFKFNKIGHTSYSLRGLIDDLSMYNCSMSTAQVQELFNDGVALDATTHSKSGNLLSYHRNDGITTWQDRRGWSYLNFDSTDYIDCGTAIGNSLGNGYSNDLTVSLWFKLASTGTSRGLFNIGAFTGGAGKVYLAYFGYGALVFRLNDAGWTKTVTGFTDLGWNHMAVVYDPSDPSGANSKLYLNGSSVGGASGAFPSSLDFNGLKTIIGAVESSSWNWEGGIKSVGLYNIAKSEAEIQTIYNAGINSSEVSNSGIINYWELDNATTIKDLVGSSDGTPSGTLVLNDGNDGDVQGTPDSITIREGLNSNKDGLGFPLTNPSSNVLRLNGVSEFVHIENDNLAGKPTGTICFWAKTSSTGNQAILGYHRDQWSIRLNKTTILFGVGGTTVTASSSLDNSGWGFHAITFDQGTAKFYKLDLDTPLYHTSTDYLSAGDVVFPSNTNGVFIGKRNHASEYFYNGLVDEVRIYDRVLTLDEITKNYKHQKGKHKND